MTKTKLLHPLSCGKMKGLERISPAWIVWRQAEEGRAAPPSCWTGNGRWGRKSPRPERLVPSWRKVERHTSDRPAWSPGKRSEKICMSNSCGFNFVMPVVSHDSSSQWVIFRTKWIAKLIFDFAILPDILQACRRRPHRPQDAQRLPRDDCRGRVFEVYLFQGMGLEGSKQP